MLACMSMLDRSSIYEGIRRGDYTPELVLDNTSCTSPRPTRNVLALTGTLRGLPCLMPDIRVLSRDLLMSRIAETL